MTYIDDYEPDNSEVDDTYNDDDNPQDEVILEERYRGGNADPAFGFVLAIALSVGLIPLLPAFADLRYTIAWGALAGVGVLGWLLGNAERIGREDPSNLAWGVALGVIVSVPFMIFFINQFEQAALLMFPELGIGTVLAFLIFVQPLAETLFFRGTLQSRLDFWIIGLLSGLWSVILFFPVMWNVLIEFAFVAIFLAIALFVLNMMFSYARMRNGLAAAWVCQITANLILFFIPFLQG